MTDRETLANELERLHRLATPGPWVPSPEVDRDRVRGTFWSTCKGFPRTTVGQMAGKETAAEREANMQIACLLRSHVPEILASLRSQDREDGARKALQWEAREGGGWAYSAELIVGMVVPRPTEGGETEWVYSVDAVRTKWITKGGGTTKSGRAAKAAVERAWGVWLEHSGLRPLPLRPAQEADDA